MRRTLTRGVVIAWLALLGCQGEPAPGPKAEVQEPAPPPPVPEEPAPPPPVQTDPFQSPTVDKFVPPVINKAPPRPPKVNYRTLQGDMGVIRPGTSAEYKFAVTNDSKIPWTVKFVTPDCNCAVGEFSSKTINPAETSYLTIGIRADQREGPRVGSIAVDFQEPDSPKLYLFLSVEIRSPLAILPKQVDLGRVGPADRPTQTFEIRNYTDRDVALPKIEAPAWMNVQLTPVTKPEEGNRARQTWKAEIQADLAKLKSPTEPGQLLVRVDGQAEPVAVPLTLKMKAPLEAAPGEVVFEKFKPGEVHERVVLLETYPNLKTLTDKDFIFSHDLGEEFSAEVAKQLGPNRFQIVARYHPKAAYASVQGELTVRVRDRDISPARVKIKGTGD